jgi:hypothetical protein
MNYNFVEIQNPATGESIITEEHSDELFNEGFTKLVRYVPNHEVDIFKLDAQREESTLRRMDESASDPIMKLKSSFDEMYNTHDSETYHYKPMEIY